MGRADDLCDRARHLIGEFLFESLLVTRLILIAVFDI